MIELSWKILQQEGTKEVIYYNHLVLQIKLRHIKVEELNLPEVTSRLAAEQRLELKIFFSQFSVLSSTPELTYLLSHNCSITNSWGCRDHIKNALESPSESIKG